MNRQEAQFLLQSYRPNGEDAADPHFQEALELAQRDPELKAWLEEQTALDAAISGKLKTISPPAHLKSAILAGRTVIEPVSWWRQPAWVAAAACLALLITAMSFWFTLRPSATFDHYRSDMATFLSTKLDRLDVNTSDMVQVQQWLADRNAHGDLVLPEGLRQLQGLGCRIVDWQGEKVALICFKLEGPQELHLFVVNRDTFRKAPPEGAPQFAKDGTWTTASWTRAGKVYVLAGQGDRGLLWKYL